MRSGPIDLADVLADLRLTVATVAVDLLRLGIVGRDFLGARLRVLVGG